MILGERVSLALLSVHYFLTAATIGESLGPKIFTALSSVSHFMNAHLLEEIVYSFVIQICIANISFDVMCYVADEILDLPTGLKII